MDENARKIVFVVDEQTRLVGTVTDGDIRRWILKGKTLDARVTCVMNAHPIVVDEHYKRDDVKQLMKKHGIECIPIVNNQRQIVSVIWWTDFFNGASTPRASLHVPVVIMAGGKGTRLYPFTHILPKPLIPVGERPIVELIMEKFSAVGCNEFYLSVNHKAKLIKAYFSDVKLPYTIRYVEEKIPSGTAGSLSLLKNKITNTFCVTNCDILIDADYADILSFHRQKKNTITLVSSMKHFTIPYGICEIAKKDGTLANIKEKPEYDFLVNTGMYFLEPSVLRDIPEHTLYHITDLINAYLRRGKKVGVYPISEKSWMDMGHIETYQEMTIQLTQKQHS